MTLIKVAIDGFCQDNKYLYMMTELVYGGDLYSLQCNSGVFPVEQAM